MKKKLLLKSQYSKKYKAQKWNYTSIDCTITKKFYNNQNFLFIKQTQIKQILKNRYINFKLSRIFSLKK